jgi:N-acetylglutamate synthase-like GNAT family acetyltransferase
LWLLRLVRFPEIGRRALALLIPGLLWAFAHVAYVRDPFYLRGVEVGIAAVFLYGLFFLHFDLTTTIMAHFTWNALLGALPMLRSGQSAFIISGLIVIAAILAPTGSGLVVALRQRRQGKHITRLNITPATTDDVTALVALGIEGVDWASLLSDPTAMVLCLQANEEIAGVIAGRVQDDGVVSIQVVYVTPGWRRQYGASVLVDEFCARLRECGAQSVEATASTRDRVATAFWASLGWRPKDQVFARSLADSGQPNWRKVLAQLVGKDG